MADRVAVLSQGRLEQFAPPTEIYDRPATLFVNRFVGTTNLLTGDLVVAAGDVGRARIPAGGEWPVRIPGGKLVAGSRVQVCIRPEHLRAGRRGRRAAGHDRTGDAARRADRPRDPPRRRRGRQGRRAARRRRAPARAGRGGSSRARRRRARQRLCAAGRRHFFTLGPRVRHLNAGGLRNEYTPSIASRQPHAGRDAAVPRHQPRAGTAPGVRHLHRQLGRSAPRRAGAGSFARPTTTRRSRSTRCCRSTRSPR